MINNKKKFLSYFLLLSLLFINCNLDYDIEEVAPAEHLSSEHDHDHSDEHADKEECPECDSTNDHDHITADMDEEHITEEVDDSHAGHNHAEGARNHGTEWFFNQLWAAPFIWGKLFRDSLIYLVLAIALFIFTARKRNK